MPLPESFAVRTPQVGTARCSSLLSRGQCPCTASWGWLRPVPSLGQAGTARLTRPRCPVTPSGELCDRVGSWEPHTLQGCQKSQWCLVQGSPVTPQGPVAESRQWPRPLLLRPVCHLGLVVWSKPHTPSHVPAKLLGLGTGLQAGLPASSRAQAAPCGAVSLAPPFLPVVSQDIPSGRAAVLCPLSAFLPRPVWSESGGESTFY